VRSTQRWTTSRAAALDLRPHGENQPRAQHPGDTPRRLAMRLRHELRLLAAEVVSIAERIWQTPIQGPTDVLERALVSHSGAHPIAA
jgi:hypothetical protein